MTTVWRRPRAWPLTIKVPLIVAGLLVTVGVIASKLVLDRLERVQQAHLRALATAYLDGTAAAIAPHVLRQDVWETFDALERNRRLYAELKVLDTVVLLPDGRVLAATDPVAYPTLRPAPERLSRLDMTQPNAVIDIMPGEVGIGRRLDEGAALIARLSVHELLVERQSVLATLIWLNAAVTLGLAAIGYASVRRMLAPLTLLTAHVEAWRDRRPLPIPSQQLRDVRTEWGRLLAGFNAMAQAWAEREALTARLAEEDKLSQLGRLASGMAHEVNNPLGGMQNAVATLRRHGADPAVRVRALDLIERGLIGISNVVRAALVSYRDTPKSLTLTPADLDDLQYLIQHEVARRQLQIRWQNHLPPVVRIDRGGLRQALLNLLLNACAAAPPRSEVALDVWSDSRTLTAIITDHGLGLPAEAAAMLRDPATSTLPTAGQGLGIWISARLIASAGGEIRVGYPVDGGTSITIMLPLQHEEALDDVA